MSIDIQPYSSGYCNLGSAEYPWEVAPECEGSSFDDPVDYISLVGFLDDVQVASLGLYLPSGPFETISLAAFPTIDRLRVEALTFLDLGASGSCSFSRGCGHFNVDNVVLDFVPEPSTGLLLGGGLAALGMRRRRRGGSSGG